MVERSPTVYRGISQGFSVTAKQAGNHEPIKIEAQTSVADDGVDAGALERAIHQALSHCRAMGEWFKAEPAEIGRAWKIAWCGLRFPAVITRWQRLYASNAARQRAYRQRKAANV